jgi:hypothetical protein
VISALLPEVTPALSVLVEAAGSTSRLEVTTVTDDGYVLNISEPTLARVYNVLYGGKDNFAVDRDAAELLIAAFPTAPLEAADSRYFALRAVRWLAQSGVRQFLELGAGFPLWTGVHDILHEELSDSGELGAVLYVADDHLAAVHLRALAASTFRVQTEVLDGDIRKPDEILESPELRRTLDLSRPVGLLLDSVLPHCEDDAVVAVQRLIAALPSGSSVVLSHTTADFLSPHLRESLAGLPSYLRLRLRSREEIAEYLAGLELMEPGWVSTGRWRPDLEPRRTIDSDHPNPLSYGVVARKG